jgi:methyl-accepting chemotaxis protein
MKFSSLTIRKKLICAFSIGAVITATLGALGYYGSVRSDTAIEEIGLVRLESVKSLQRMALALERINRAEEQLLNLGFPLEERELIQREFARSLKDSDEARQKYESVRHGDEEIANWRKFLVVWCAWREAHDAYAVAESKFTSMKIPNPDAIQSQLASFRGTHCQLHAELMSHIYHGTPMTSDRDRSTCLFNEWLSKEAPRMPAFQQFATEVQASHQRTHELLSQAQAMMAQGDKEGAMSIAAGDFATSMQDTLKHIDGALAVLATCQQHISAMDETMQAVDSKIEPLHESLKKLVEVNVQAADDAVASAVQFSKTQKAVALSAMLVGVVVAMALGIYISGKISRPIRRAADMLKDISEGEGDLTRRLHVSTQDELGDLATYFNKFVEKLQGIVGQITGNVSTVASSATELAATATQLSGGAEETTNQSAQVAAATEQMSSNMTSMATASEQMSQNVRSVSVAIDEVTASISEMAQSAEKAASSASSAKALVDTSNTQIVDLTNAADQIGKVIEVIQDIAEQTNLLALNATIEAARAGDAGRGFAVVATEVKELAKQTASATEDIRQRIEGIQSSTNMAVKSITGIGDIVRQVNDLSRTIAAAVEEQSAATKEIANTINQSSVAAESVARGITESATASQEISRVIAGVDIAARQTAQGAIQTQSTGRELSQVAEQLQSLVGQFKV